MNPPLNRIKIVNQLKISGKDNQTRIPDGILYINGLPLVVFEFKSAVREQEASIGDAWKQLCKRYRRDIPQLFIYNALCIISDGVNNRMGNLFAPYEYFYSWRKVTGNENREQDGIPSLHSMIQGLFHPVRLLDVIKNFICFPDKAKHEVKFAADIRSTMPPANSITASSKRVNLSVAVKAALTLAQRAVVKVTPCNF